MLSTDQKALFQKVTAAHYKKAKLQPSNKLNFSHEHLESNWNFVQGRSHNPYKMGSIGFMLNHMRYDHRSLSSMFYEQAALETLLHSDASAKGAKDLATFKRGAAILGIDLALKNLSKDNVITAGFNFSRAISMRPDLFFTHLNARVTSPFKPMQKLLDQLQDGRNRRHFLSSEFQQYFGSMHCVGNQYTYNGAKQDFMREGEGRKFKRVRYPTDVKLPVGQRVKNQLRLTVRQWLPWLP